MIDRKKVLLIFPILLILIFLGLAYQLRFKNQVPPGYQTYASNQSHITFAYPKTWYLDRSQEANGGLTVFSKKDSTLTEMSVVGSVAINTLGENPKRLSPEAWFRGTILPNIDPPKDMHSRQVGPYHAYSATAMELQERVHIYIFKSRRVVEVAYPIDQPKFTAVYEQILQSLKLD